MLAEAPVVNDGSEPVPEGRGELDVNIHQFTYPQTDHPALENVNFALKPGQMLGICGPTGSGNRIANKYTAGRKITAFHTATDAIFEYKQGIWPWHQHNKNGPNQIGPVIQNPVFSEHINLFNYLSIMRD
uniref:Uncharacterized protein n=1 Tax=uncultured organism TaxID=155900 RepID=A0A385FVL5_9ZZZZ|nr:hypothetical protein TRI12_00015 [uncultured organism]